MEREHVHSASHRPFRSEPSLKKSWALCTEPGAFADCTRFLRTTASNGCWCMYWRIGPEYHKRPREKNKSEFRRIMMHGPPPGLLAFDGERPVGWCQLTPRHDLTWLNR